MTTIIYNRLGSNPSVCFLSFRRFRMQISRFHWRPIYESNAIYNKSQTVCKFISADHLTFFLFVCKPFTVSQFRFGKFCLKRRLFRRTGIDPESDFFAAFPQMTNTHLLELNAVVGILYAIVRAPSTQPIPHGFNFSVDICWCPVGITVIRDHASKP